MIFLLVVTATIAFANAHGEGLRGAYGPTDPAGGLVVDAMNVGENQGLSGDNIRQESSEASATKRTRTIAGKTKGWAKHLDSARDGNSNVSSDRDVRVGGDLLGFDTSDNGIEEYLQAGTNSKVGGGNHGDTSESSRTQAKPLDRLNLKLFFGAQDLALWVAEEKGYFLQYHLDVNYTYTPTSLELRKDLADGQIDLAFAAVDNSVLTYEQMGETVILMGGDSSGNEFIVQPDVASLSDMANRTLIVDYPSSAFALQAFNILKIGAGLEPTDYNVVKVGSTHRRYQAMVGENAGYDASLLYAPFSILSQQGTNNLKSLGKATSLGGAYQSMGLFVMQDWLHAKANNANKIKVTRFIAAWIKGLRWAMDPSNKHEVLIILQSQFEIDEDIAQQTYSALMTPGFGLTKDAEFLFGGFENVLRIREEFVGGGPYDADSFVDLKYYHEALKLLDSDGLELSIS